MVKISAGLLLFRRTGGTAEMFLVHPGGPFWAKKDAGTWSVPKGEADEGENLQAAAKREFTEETGLPIPDGTLLPLGFVRYGNKKVTAWALEGDADPAQIKSNVIQLEWPPKSGKAIDVPECDKADWVTLDAAQTKLVKGQIPFVEALAKQLGVPPPESPPHPADFIVRLF
jgi:predicted NUDIX family NTP pyrophosphohydrolase